MNVEPRPEAAIPAVMRSKHLLIVTALLAAAAGTAAWVFGSPAAAAGESTAPASAAAPLPSTALTVDTVMPQQVTMARRLAASGSLHAVDELSIGSDASGVRLLAVTVDVGARVRRGQLLARGDDAVLLAQRAQQDALVRQARAELAQADANLARADSIKDSGVYSDEAVQTRRTAAEAAAAKLDLALAQRHDIELRIEQTRVLAPADGTIARRSATVGAVMQPGQELFRLIRDDRIEWRAEVPDHALETIAPGAPVELLLAGGRRAEGRVRLVAPTVDARTRNGVVHATLAPATAAGSHAPLRAGAHVQGEIHVGSANLWTLPEAVLLTRDGQSFVYVVGAHGVARATRVQTGARQDGRVEVAGLPPDARVVATGAGFVKDGERVRVADSPPETPPGRQAANGPQTTGARS